MATILEQLQQQAEYRPSGLASIANLLTGGLLGEATGMNRRDAEARVARRALLSSQLEDAMMARRQQEIQRRLEDQYRMQAELQAKQEQEREQRRAATVEQGQLAENRAFLRSRGVQIGEPDPETARAMAMQVTQEEADKAKQRQTGMNLTLANGSQIYGTFDELQRLSQTNPMIADALANKAPRQRPITPTLSATTDKDTGQVVLRIENIPAGADIEELSAMINKMTKLGGGTAMPTPPPSGGPKPEMVEPQSVGKYKVRIKQ